MGRRRCCCYTCIVFQDGFERTGPTEEIGGSWNWRDATGEWWLDEGSLWEVSGSGEILGPHAPAADGYQASYQIVDEQPHNKYQIIFGAVTDEPGADAIVAEFYVGDWDGAAENSTITLYERKGGVYTPIASKDFPCPAVDGRGGRRFYVANTQGVVCAWVTHSAYPSHISGIHGGPPGRYFGAGNASGQLAIRIDDYEVQQLHYTDSAGQRSTCFACTCVCLEESETEGGSLFPGELQLRISGQCCTPFMEPCDLGPCPGAVDDTLTLTFTQDYPSAGMNSWYNHDPYTLCGYPFEFRLECDGSGSLSLGMYWEPYPGSGWVEIPLSGAILLNHLSHSCSPIREVWQLLLRSLSGFPCCIGCTTGEYAIVVTA